MNDFSNRDQLYFNRELSWLEFNHRVLGEAMREETPLLERLKFLAISGSNLDEFFMVRVGGLLMQSTGNPEKTGIAGMNPDEQLVRIRDRVRRMVDDQYRCLNEQLLPGLAARGIRRLKIDELDHHQMEQLRKQFDEHLGSSATPIALVDEGDFPLMIGTSLAVCFRVQGPQLRPSTGDDGSASLKGNERVVIVPVSRGVPRYFPLSVTEGFGFILAEDALIEFGDHFLPRQRILETAVFRVTRNADVELDEEAAADLLIGMQAMLLDRNSSPCVRLEIEAAASPEIVAFLQSLLDIGADRTWHVPGPIDLSACMELATGPRLRDLKFEPWPGQPLAGYEPGQDVFDFIAEEDRLLSHPFQNYDPVVDFIQAAATDPRVIAIKQTLYRTSSDSQIIAALKTAAENGKHVTVILELKARFDEKRNIDWARQLERAGVDVIYGVRGLKTHAKLCLVVRREPTGVRRYVHFGTGNYNEATSRLYTDMSLLTCDEALGNDAVNLLNAVTGLSSPLPMHKLSAAPSHLRERFEELIDVEIANARKGRPAMIQAKVNALVDETLIDHLYRASGAGVRIDLNVRGICCLKPGVAGLSEKIRVVSIVDRFLEHSRLFYFLHGGDHLAFIASADWMNRNLDRRVELLVPVEHPACSRRVIDVLRTCLGDNTRAYELQPDGEWQPLEPGKEVRLRAQEHLYAEACEEAHRAARQSREMFRPHRASG